MMSRCRIAALATITVLAGCQGRKKGPVDRDAAKALFEQLVVATPPGMSDLALDERGMLWGVPERDRMLVELPIGKPPVTHLLDEVPFGVDTEALVWLGADKLAIGYEGATSPTAGLLFAERRGDKFVVTGTRELTEAQLGVKLTINHGIESLCGRDGELLVASETVGTQDGKRWASLVRVRGDALHVTKLWLTTDRGKIAALHCTIADDGAAQVIAIERHYGVARILSFTVGRDAPDVTPTVVHDLHPVLRDAFNLEGIARLPDGRTVLINDNQGKRAEGPTQLFVFHPK